MRAAPPLALALSLGACGTVGGAAPAMEETDAGTASAYAVCGATAIDGTRVDVEMDGATVAAVLPAGESTRCGDATAVDASGQWIVPAFIDSHVHLSYYEVADELARGGVAAAVDLAAPMSALARGRSAGEPRVLHSGPMLTAVGGYPTVGWGAGGYGMELSTPEEAVAAVETLHAAGATLIKVPLHGPPTLSDDTIRAITDRAHALDMRVAIHALGDAEAFRGAELGGDVLAHTPVEPLSPTTLDAWRGRAVVSTLAAFGSSPSAAANLVALRDHEVTVLYGTDLGNSRELGIQPSEIAALVEAGFDGRAVIEAGTIAPATFWGLEGLGGIEAGGAASFLLLDADPLEMPGILSEPTSVVIDGEWRTPAPRVPDLWNP